MYGRMSKRSIHFPVGSKTPERHGREHHGDTARQEPRDRERP